MEINMEKEKLQSNKIVPTLFVGVGGIGGRIIKGVADLCKNDDKNNMRFVVLDTDTNDISRLNSETPITAVQTSSTRKIKEYLSYDKEAKDNWFPNNRILDYKTVSEGAGQVRAISRLALNATIKQNKIKSLYDAINELYLKDGSDQQRAIKVVIASTATGGTGSGIALEVSMLIRDYINRNYPESSSIIRGFFIMPGVMRTKIKSESEMASQERNGYATLREINAFMMKGSGFFETTDELKRYKGLSISVPNTDGTNRNIDNLPFDFCFLIEKNDNNQKTMKSLSQYEKTVSQCIYEQNISVLSKKASSQEDNVIKTFIDPKLLGRSRFGSVGAGVLRYPYEQIRDYIAYCWAEKNILGVRNVKNVDNEELVKNTWVAWDKEYEQQLKEYENGSRNEQPKLSEVYINGLDSSTSDFGLEIQKNISLKYGKYVDDQSESDIFSNKVEKIAEQFIINLKKELMSLILQDSQLTSDDINNVKTKKIPIGNQMRRIEEIHVMNQKNERIKELSKNFIKKAMGSTGTFSQNLEIGNYSLENLAYIGSGNIMHPNALRAVLYKLRNLMDDEMASASSGEDEYIKKYNEIYAGKDDDKNKTKSFQVKGNGQKEINLSQMVRECENANFWVKLVDHNCSNRAQKLLEKLFKVVNERSEAIVKRKVCEEGLKYINPMIKEIEKFYNSFESKIPVIEKRKKELVGEIEYKKGDCVKNILSTEKMLDKVVELQTNSVDNSQMFADLFTAFKENAEVSKKKEGNPSLLEAYKDIFNDVIIDDYKKEVANSCDDKINLDILHGLKYEFEISQMIKASEEKDEDQKDVIIKNANDRNIRNQYINDSLKELRTLAAPMLSIANIKEEREVSEMSYGAGVNDDDPNINISDFKDYLDKENKTPSISKYEIHCFRSNYGLTPDDISALKYVTPESDGILYSEDSGEYFKNYQKYMEDIGPDSTLNPVITPHIDKKWNSISVMPEMNLDYQRMLMGHIHEAFFYSFIYKNVKLMPKSTYNTGDKAYCYDGDNKNDFLLTSDGKTCNKLYEVLESLYFDRKRVNDIHKIALDHRSKDAAKPTTYDKTKFFIEMSSMKRSEIVDGADDTEKMSVFELPMLYYGSLPTKSKDSNELKTMVQALMYVLKREILTVEKKNDADVLWVKVAGEQYNILQENYKKVKILENAGWDTLDAIKDSIRSYLSRKNADVRYFDDLIK